MNPTHYLYVNPTLKRYTTFATDRQPISDPAKLTDGTFLPAEGWELVTDAAQMAAITHNVSFTSVGWIKGACFKLGGKVGTAR